jgi:hypothetical protein
MQSRNVAPGHGSQQEPGILIFHPVLKKRMLEFSQMLERSWESGQLSRSLNPLLSLFAEHLSESRSAIGLVGTLPADCSFRFADTEVNIGTPGLSSDSDEPSNHSGQRERHSSNGNRS